MRISIAMATYNGAKYLQEQLDSFLYQTRQPDELVVCDDGSTDATLEILEAFRQQAPFAVHIHRNETNLGYIKNFEKALSLCTGDIIFLSDQDDVWFNSKIEVISREFASDSESWVIVNDAELVREDLATTGLTVAGQLISAGVGVEHLLLGCCIAFKSELKPLLFPIPSHIHGHDGWINTLGNALKCRRFVPTVLQSYRRHDTNTSSSPTTSTRSATRYHMLKEKLKWSNIRRNPSSATVRRLEQINGLATRLKAHAVYLQRSLPEKSSLAEAISKLEQEKNANELRLSLQQRPLKSRLFKSLGFYLSGGYRQFEGWKSLARDILQ